MRHSDSSVTQLFASSHYHSEIHKAVWQAVSKTPNDLLHVIHSGMGVEDAYTVLSVGPDRLGLPLHGHAQAWLAQLYGSKMWTFLPSDFTFSTLPSRVYHELFFRSPGQWSTTVQDYFASRPEYAPTQCIARPGDIIGVPSCYFHATQNLGETFSLGGQMDITVNEDFLENPMLYADQMPNSTVQLRNTAMLLEAAGNLQAALRFAVPLLRQHPLELNMAMRTIRWYAGLNQVSSALKTLLFYLKQLAQLHREGLISNIDHAKYTSEFCLEFQSGLNPASYIGLAVNDNAGGQIDVPLLLQQVYKAAVQHHASGEKGLAMCQRHFKLVKDSVPSASTSWSFQLTAGLLIALSIGWFAFQSMAKSKAKGTVGQRKYK